MGSDGHAPPPACFPSLTPPSSLFSPTLPKKRCSCVESRVQSEPQGRSAWPRPPTSPWLVPLSPLKASEGDKARLAGDGGLPGNAGLGNREKAFAFLFLLFTSGQITFFPPPPHGALVLGSSRSVHRTHTHPKPRWVPDPLACLGTPAAPQALRHQPDTEVQPTGHPLPREPALNI